MLGKRQRSLVMRRTTSMASMPSAPKQGRQAAGGGAAGPSSSVSAGAVGGTGPAGGSAPSPWRADARSLAAGVKTAAFLMACGLCSKDLGPGKDTYIYRGEVAFCSHECRERQIEKDELMEHNCSLTSIREAPPPSSAAAAGGPDGGDAVAAA